MPKQVWQADDGSIHSSEEDCLKHEASDRLLRHLFDANGDKRHISDYEDLEVLLDQENEFTDMCGDVPRLLCWLHSCPDLSQQYQLLGMARAMEQLGAYLSKYQR